MATRTKPPTKPRQPWNFRNVLISVAVLLGGLFLIQVFYPDFNLPPGVKISGKELSGWNKKAAIKELNRAYTNSEIEVFLADSEDSFKVVRPADFGLEIDNTRRVNLIEYPWYIKIIPTSLFWWGAVVSVSEPNQKFDDIELQKFVEKNFGTPCHIEPRDASLTIDGSSINIGKSSIGGTCYQAVVKDSFKNARFSSPSSGSVRIDLTVERPSVTTADATNLAMEVSPNLINDLVLEFDDIADSVTLTSEELASWVLFKVVDGQLELTITQEKSEEFYKTRVAPLVEQGAGVTTIIATADTSAVRVDGIEGRVINTTETNLRISEYLRGLRKTVTIAVESTDPSISYVYSRPQSEQTEADATTDEDDQTEATEADD
jgi:hypothetical protein